MIEVQRISSISFKELVELRSTLHALSYKEFVCSYCQGKYANRPDAEFMLEKIKKQKGCEVVGPDERHFIMQGETQLRYNTCIGNFVSDSSIYWIHSYNHFEAGTMPFSGGYMDQPAKIIDIMNVIGAHKNEQIQKQTQRRKQSSRNNVRMIKRGRQ